MSLSLRDVSVSFGAFTAVRDVSLSISDGEVLGLLGPSGSGKSTLLRAIAGLETDVSGGLYWDGADLGSVPVHRRGFGLVFQEGQLFQHHDVAGNIAFGLRMHGYSKRERTRRVTELLELVGLSGYRRQPVSELSGGQAQRVALARALAVRPNLLLLDEPLSGLDASLREELAVELADVLRDEGITTMLVTHDQEEAFTLADTVAVLDAGEVRQAAPVREVWSRPANDAVATFLGVTTVLDATVHRGRLRCGLGEVDLPGVTDGPVRLGLRPMGVRLAESGTKAEVLSVLRRRDHTRLVVSVAGVVDRLDAVTGLADDVQPGESVSIRLDPDGLARIGAGGVGTFI